MLSYSPTDGTKSHKYGAGFSNTKVLGYHPLLATRCAVSPGSLYRDLRRGPSFAPGTGSDPAQPLRSGHAAWALR
jgi:hypothetical protein